MSLKEVSHLVLKAILVCVGVIVNVLDFLSIIVGKINGMA